MLTVLSVAVFLLVGLAFAYFLNLNTVERPGPGIVLAILLLGLCVLVFDVFVHFFLGERGSLFFDFIRIGGCAISFVISLIVLASKSH